MLQCYSASEFNVGVVVNAEKFICHSIVIRLSFNCHSIVNQIIELWVEVFYFDF